MGIAVITIPGDSKLEFVDELNKKTGSKVELLILKRAKRPTFLTSFKNLLSKADITSIMDEIRYAILLRLNTKARKSLEYFREVSSKTPNTNISVPKILEVESVNSEEVYSEMKKLSPDLLVIWGSDIIKPHILSTAKKAINLHMGTCPHYRGSLCNQFAVLQDDFSKIGATIHYAVEKVDSGKIISLITADTSKPPKELFRDLNDRAKEKYLEVAEKLFKGIDIPSEEQDLSIGKNFTSKQWTKKTRYNLGKKMLRWEKYGIKEFIA